MVLIHLEPLQYAIPNEMGVDRNQHVVATRKIAAFQSISLDENKSIAWGTTAAPYKTGIRLIKSFRAIEKSPS